MPRGENSFGIARPERFDGVGQVAADGHSAVLELAAAELERVGRVGQVELGVVFEMLGQIRGHGLQGGVGLGRQEQQLPRSGVARVVRRGSLLDDAVRIGAPNAEGADPGPAHSVALPRGKLGIDVERAFGEVDLRVGPLEVEGGGNLLVLQRQDRLDEARHSGSRVEMSDVGLDRPDRAEAFLVGSGPERSSQGGDFDGISQLGAGSVGFDVADCFRLNSRHGLRHGDHLGLALDARGGVPDLQRAVVVHCRALDHRVNRVAVVQGVGEPLEDHDPDAVAAEGAPGRGVERPAVAVGRRDPSLPVVVAALAEIRDRHAAGQGHVALVAEQALAGLADGHQRRGARRLNVDAGPPQVEPVRDVSAQEVLVAGDHQLVSTHGFGQLPVRIHILKQIHVHAGPGVDGDRAVVARRVAAGVFQRFGGTLQKEAVLGIGHLGFPRGVVEECGVEQLPAFEQGRGLDVVGVIDQLRVDAGLDQLVVGEERHALDAVAEIAPELVEVAGLRESTRHADHGNAAQNVMICQVRHFSPWPL